MQNRFGFRLGGVAGLAGLLLAAATGCPRGNEVQPVAKEAEKTKPRPLVLLVADDPQLGKAIAREWQGRTEEELTVRDISLEELEKANRLPCDAVIFPSGWLGHLCERDLLVPLDSDALEDPAFNHRDIFDLVRLREMRWGGRTMAAPLGSPQLLLCYRADLFESRGLTAPTDWKTYQEVVEAFAEMGTGEMRPTIESLAEGWAGQLLLARAAGYAMHRDQVSPLFALGTGEPLIDQPPYVRAMEELVAAAKAANTADKRLTPGETFLAVYRGECAMAIGWPVGGQEPDVTGAPRDMTARLAFAPLPSGQQSYRFATRSWLERDDDDTAPVPLLATAGRMAAVSSSSPDARRASGFILWLAGGEVSEQVASKSTATTLFRQSQIARSSRWTPLLSPDESRQYAETLASVLASPRAMPGITIPGRDDYLAALDEAVHQALAGKPAKAALQEAAGRWREITGRLGADAQRRAQARSLGQTGM